MPERHGAEPVGVDVVLVTPAEARRLAGGVDEQVVGALVPVLAEGGAAHPDDGHLVRMP